jgi:hypothetical protein
VTRWRVDPHLDQFCFAGNGCLVVQEPASGMHPLRSARQNGRIVSLCVAVPDAPFEDEADRRKPAMGMPGHARVTAKILRGCVVQQHEWVEVRKLLGWKRLPDGKRAHGVSLGKNDVGDRSKTHAAKTC